MRRPTPEKEGGQEDGKDTTAQEENTGKRKCPTKNKREKKYTNIFETHFRISIHVKPILLNTKEDAIPVSRHSFRPTTAH